MIRHSSDAHNNNRSIRFSSFFAGDFFFTEYFTDVKYRESHKSIKWVSMWNYVYVALHNTNTTFCCLRKCKHDIWHGVCGKLLSSFVYMSLSLAFFPVFGCWRVLLLFISFWIIFSNKHKYTSVFESVSVDFFSDYYTFFSFSFHLSRKSNVFVFYGRHHSMCVATTQSTQKLTQDTITYIKNNVTDAYTKLEYLLYYISET